jgi:hypothetical protein
VSRPVAAGDQREHERGYAEEDGEGRVGDAAPPLPDAPPRAERESRAQQLDRHDRVGLRDESAEQRSAEQEHRHAGCRRGS